MSLDIYLETNFCPHCKRADEVHWQNITHNLARMAREAGICDILWEPKEHGIENAGQLVEPLRKALADMRGDPARFRKHDDPGGWGTYDQFVPWLVGLLEACGKHPQARVTVSR